MMRKFGMLAACLGYCGLVLIYSVSLSQAAQPAYNMDTSFVQKAMQDSTTEIKAGQLILKRSKSPQIRNLAQTFILDHQKANRDLKVILQKEHKKPLSPSSSQTQTLNKLSNLSGSTLDRQFLTITLKNDQETVSLLQQEMEKGRSVPLKIYAANYLPTFQTHLDMLRDAQTNMK